VTAVAFNRQGGDRLWLLQTRDRAEADRLSQELLGQHDATITREDYHGVEISVSSDSKRGAAAVVADFVALGPKELVIRLIDSNQRGEALASSPQFLNSARPDSPGVILTFSSVNEESAEMMKKIAEWSKSTTRPQVALRLPLAASSASFGEDGIRIETKSAFGNLPVVLSMMDGK
jgi:hypothetical protein